MQRKNESICLNVVNVHLDEIKIGIINNKIILKYTTFVNAKNFVLPRKLRQVAMMRRFETMMATATAKIRPACRRASNECSSMPSPFRAASPHPPLDAFTLHPFRDLSAARYQTFLEACTFCTLVSFVTYVPKAIPHPQTGTFKVLRQMNPRY